MRLKRPALILLVLYAILFGATYDGILDAQRRLISVILVGGLTVLWLWSRRRWGWHRTPLDWAILLWCAAFALALAANLESWRRIAIGLWFMSLYIGIWYVLQDALASRALRREWLVDALLIAGVPVVFVGYAQVELALTSGLPVPRPVGTLGNPNSLAAFLVMLIPFALGRFSAARTPLARVLLGFYSLMALGLLFLSYSRAGWLGAAAAIAVWVSLRFPLRRWWVRQSRLLRGFLLMVGAGVLIGGLVFMAQSFGIAGRTLELRTWIYETALQLFGERPLTGHGLFTFGAGLSRLNSLPPFEPHSHAHNIILNVAAELGIVGLAALALTARLAFRAMRRKPDSTAVMGIAAFAGFAAHQLFDLPAMLPVIALVALFSLVLAVPASSEPVARARWQPVLLALGGLALAGLGLWDALQYRAYVAALSDGITSGDYRAAAERLQPLADADPMLAIYPQQQGMLLGWAAAEGDTQAAEAAIERFRRYTALEPGYASGWANLAALYDSLGAKTPAEDAMRRAVELAPQSWSLVYRFAIDAEAAGDTETARQAYQRAVALARDIVRLPEWDQSPLRRELEVDESALSSLAQTLLLLERGELEAAHHVWDTSAARSAHYSNNHVVDLLFALIDGDRARAEAEYQAALPVALDHNARVWTYVGAAFLNDADFDQQIAAARAARDGSPFSSDWDSGANIDYIQYLSLATPRQFLPQVGYTEVDPALLRLLGDADALTRLHAVIRGSTP